MRYIAIVAIFAALYFFATAVISEVKNAPPLIPTVESLTKAR